MRNCLIPAALLFVLISQASSTQAQQDTLATIKRSFSFHSKEVNLTKGEQIAGFNRDTASNRQEKGQISIGSFDGTQFKLHYTHDKIIIVESEQKKEPLQNRIHITAQNFKATGYANQAIIELWPTNPANYWYLVKIGTMENKLDSIQGPIKLKLKATCIDSSLYPVIRIIDQGNDREVFVLPHTADKDNRYKKKHKKKERAIFSTITITDSGNNSYSFEQGNYFLMEGKEIYFNR